MPRIGGDIDTFSPPEFFIEEVKITLKSDLRQDGFSGCEGIITATRFQEFQEPETVPHRVCVKNLKLGEGLFRRVQGQLNFEFPMG